ncbi:MAG TPA: tetratricopeptide repeat protein, partial [Chitinophagales bacterium]|nr:tetratricopeptide repeat protein [Chitinophagales bacterium]
LWLTGLFFLFSLLSKGQAVTLPIALLLIDFYLDRQLKGKALLEKIPFLALSLVFGVIAIIAQKKGNAISYFPLPDRILFACYGFAQYIFKVFIPVHLSGFYPYPNAVNGHYPPWLYLNAAAGVVLLIIPTILLFLQIKKGNKSNQPIIKSMLFGWLFFFLNIALLLQLLPVGLAIMADRYTYLSYTGLFLIIAALVLELKTKYKWVMPLVIFYLLFLGFTTYQRTGVWRNSKTFLKDVIAKYPEDSTAQHKLILLENFERIDSMTAPYNNAIYQQPGNPLGYFNRGIYYQQNGLVDSAIADYSRALNIKHDFMEAYEKRGICYAGEKNWNAALADFTSALNLDPSKSPAHYMNIGNIYKELGKNDSAIVMYGLAIQVNSGVPGFYMNRSGAYFNTGDYQSALKDVMKAQQLGAPVDTGYLNAINSHLK